MAGMLFAHLKRILRLDRLRLRGPSGAKDEFLLAATAQNLRRLARLRPAMPPTRQHPSPQSLKKRLQPERRRSSAEFFNTISSLRSYNLKVPAAKIA
jgi:hypothetical protein